jgi:Mg-chelatase subunit ChlD
MKLKAGLQALAAGVVFAFGAVKAEAAIIDLGFALDASGSIGTTNFQTARNALAQALGQIPFGGPDTYRVSVVTFANSAQDVVTATINSAAALAGVQNAVANAFYTQGATCISCGTNELVSNFQGLGGLGDFTLFNVITDGEPTVGTTSGATLRTSLTAAGVDGISAEAIGAFDLSQTPTRLGSF